MSRYPLQFLFAALAASFVHAVGCAEADDRPGRLTKVVESNSTGYPPLGLNLTAVRDYASEYPFVDVFRSARPWISQRSGAAWGKGDPLDLREDGYPAKLADNAYVTTIVLNAPGFPTGEYVLRHDGRGKLKLKGDLTVRQASEGRIAFRKGPTPNVLIDLIETDVDDPLRNIRIYMPGTEKTGEDGQVRFAEPFLERCRRFQCLRFMDWMGTNNSEIATWDQRPRVEDFSWASHGVPVEIMVELANTLDIDPWFCMPHLADADYIEQFAALVQKTLSQDRTVYVEHSNEVWNGQFAQAKHAGNEGLRLGLSKNRYQAQLFYHAKRSALVSRAWKAAFPDEPDRVVGVFASQSVNPWVTEQLLADPESAQFADAVAIAPYFGGEFGASESAEAIASLSAEELIARCRQSIAKNAEMTKKQAELAAAHGCRLIAYEGGQHLVGHGGAENNQELMTLFHAANRHPDMQALYKDAMTSWAKADGDLFVVFSSVSVPSKWGSWGLLEYDGQPATEAPKWRAVDAALDEQTSRGRSK